MFFHRAELTVRYTHRGLTLSVPDRDRLLNACEPSQRHRLQRCLGPASPTEPPWVVQWQKMPGDELLPDEVIVTLHREGVVVELAFAQKGVLAEWQVVRGAEAAAGKKLATLDRRAKATAAAVREPSTVVVQQYLTRQRRDAATIAALQAELTSLQSRLDSRKGSGGSDAKFRRLKTEFSKRFHPDASPASDAERERRARVFQEFWPVLEDIERS
jgi:pyruvate/2-oxoglutarate dehydrogenase complex dihydrolipoamide acyltransferase (E2) component